MTASESASERASCAVSAKSPCVTDSAVQSRTILVQPEVGPQINPAYVLIRGKRIRCSAPENHTVVNDVRAVGDSQRLAYVVIGDQHTDAPLLQVKHDLLNLGHRNR